jgi:BirA family biotin operon repressor/biotin-[acetyl-CoA-carboxylase] ligase
MNYEIRKYELLTSTQTVAKDFIKNNQAQHGLTIIAKRQSQGIGRLDREWFSPKGGLWLSSIYLKRKPIELFKAFPLRIGMTIIKELEKTFDIDLYLKWPNDIILENRKLGGIIVDLELKGGEVNYCICGIGINVCNSFRMATELIKQSAISLNDILKKDECPLSIVQDKATTAIWNLFDNLESFSIKSLKDDWKRKSYLYNQNVRFQTKEGFFEGYGKGITSEGYMKVELKNRDQKIITAGDVLRIEKEK